MADDEKVLIKIPFFFFGFVLLKNFDLKQQPLQFGGLAAGQRKKILGDRLQRKIKNWRERRKGRGREERKGREGEQRGGGCSAIQSPFGIPKKGVASSHSP